jgi:hypothetical protein
MSTPFWGNIDSRRLARAYVALAFAQDVAKLIEEILEDVLPEEEVFATDDTDYTELTM